MAIDPREILAMLMAGTGARTGQLSASGLNQPGPTSAPSAFASPAHAAMTRPIGPEGLFPPRVPGLAGPIHRRMRHPRASRGTNQIPKAIKSPILPGTAKGLTTKQAGMG